MILATIIRLEMAYPGVGILAGDSLQYLSIVTAHAVIMVFFMIMPLIFGAFGNFLLPTQLGVHDVAFPRLNSAAFWFLPGGLLMLAQLVCLDRRYQRMNCFNIRELQTLLKNRYHPDLVDERLYTDFLAQTTLNTRFKLFNTDLITPRMAIFHDYPLNNAKLSRKTTLIRPYRASQEYLGSKIQSLLNNYIGNYVRDLQQTFLLPSYFSTLSTLSPLSVSGNLPVLDGVRNGGNSQHQILGLHPLTSSFRLPNLSLNLPSLISELFKNTLPFLTSYPSLVFDSIASISYYSVINDVVIKLNLSAYLNKFFSLTAQPSPHLVGSTLELSNLHLPLIRSSKVHQEAFNHELSGDYRFQKTQNPVFKYDFKVGHYLTDNVKVLSRQLFTTFNDTTGGVRKSP